MLFDDLERRHAERDRHQENSGRLAQAFAKFHSVGQGSIEFGRRVDFDLTFIEEPYVTYGAQIDLDELGELLATPVADPPPLPSASGFVTEWDIDERGFYTGCWCAVSVYFPTTLAVPVDAKVDMFHHFTFTAIAIKDVPVDVRD